MPSSIDIDPAVSDPYGFENVDTAQTHGRTDRHLTDFASLIGRVFSLLI